jgi:YedE family putative selenium metabolism protein
MLRGDAPPRRRAAGLALALGVGGICAALVALGNPGNMGVCGACFLRDDAGALGLQAKGPQIFRPEVTGVAIGALLLSLAMRRPVGRSGSHAATRFIFGLWMGIAALVFLGCPFRMLQRLGGGDFTAWAALPGFVGGVGAGLWLEKRGYSVGRTEPAPLSVGLLGTAFFVALLALFLVGGVLLGPGPGDAGKPPHAAWLAALALAAVAGAALSATGFCAVSAARQVFRGPRWMLGGAAALILGYAVVSLVTGTFKAGSAGQPIAHGDWLWNALALALVGLAGALAGGCPVRQIVMTGEGNGDAFVAVLGITVGGALAHNLGLVSAAMSDAGPGGPTAAGRTAVVAGLAFSVAYGLWRTRDAARAGATAS